MPRKIPLTDLPVVGDDGKATFPVQIDALPSTTRLLTAGVTVRMRESGGRAVEETLDLDIKTQGDVIGIRPDFEGGEVPEGALAKFTVIAIDPDGERKALPAAQWSLIRVDRDYQWYRSGNSWNYEAMEHTKSISTGKLDIAADGLATVSMPSTGAATASKSIGRTRTGRQPASNSTPAGMWLRPRRRRLMGWKSRSTRKYAPGEVAALKVLPRFAGELLVTVGADRLFQTFTASVPEGGSTVEIPVSAEWGAGAYVTATLFRPGEARKRACLPAPSA